MTRSLTRIHVEGFRSLEQVDLSFGRVTVLIGPNGSGKSNLLAFLRMVGLLRTQSLRVHVGTHGGASAFLHYGPKVTPEMSFRLEFEDETGTYAYAARLQASAGDRLVFGEETVGHRPAGADSFESTSLGSGHMESKIRDAARDPGKPLAAARVDAWLSQISYFHFHDTSLLSPLRQNSRQVDIAYLRPDGSNLAAYLRTLEQSTSEEGQKAWTLIQRLVSRVAPFLKALRPALVNPEHPATSTVRLDWVDEREHIFESHYLSDGTLRSIALFTALAQPEDRLPAFITIDEPELGLHPAALGLLAGLIRSVSAHSQIVLATQAPALLDLFDPGDTVVTERRGGVTSLRRLDPEALSGWLEDYSMSELLDMNVLGGRP